MSRHLPRRTMPLRAVLDRWDDVVERWGLDSEERTAVIGRVADGPVDRAGTYEAHRAEERMRLAVELDLLLAAFHGDDERVRAWLRAPAPNLDGRVPLEMMAVSTEWTRWFIRNIEMLS